MFKILQIATYDEGRPVGSFSNPHPLPSGDRCHKRDSMPPFLGNLEVSEYRLVLLLGIELNFELFLAQGEIFGMFSRFP